MVKVGQTDQCIDSPTDGQTISILKRFNKRKYRNDDFQSDIAKHNGPTEGPMDQPTNAPTDGHTYPLIEVR